MRSKRIVRIQRRAKRRLFLMAIVATACIGYNALSLFAEDHGVFQPSIAKMSSVPGVKAVGIRLINTNASTQSIPNTSVSKPPSAAPPLPPPQMLPTPGSILTLDGTSAGASLTMVADMNKQSTPTGFSSLPVPPRMSDVLPSSSSGKVVMKLNNASDEGNESRLSSTPQIVSSLPSSQLASSQLASSQPTTETVDIRVIKPFTMGEPAQLAPLILEKSPKRIEEFFDTASVPPPQTGVRVSAGDSIETKSIARALINVSEPKSRAPQLVKTKATQVSHSVVMAQATDLELPSFLEQSEEMNRLVDVDTSSVPQEISNGTSVPYAKTGPVPKKNQGKEVVALETVEDPLFEIGPAMGIQVSSPNPERNVDHTRRKFDSQTSSQTANATIELESLSATNIDLTGKLVGIAIQDESICKIIQNERMISLVGNQVGTTLVQIWSVDLGDKPQVIRVNVSHKKGKVPASHDEVKDIKQVITQNFPKADVNIVGLTDGGIEVRGTTESEDSARRILELVRKVYLVPVKDRLKVSQ